jgi:hypothetical protein
MLMAKVEEPEQEERDMSLDDILRGYIIGLLTPDLVQFSLIPRVLQFAEKCTMEIFLGKASKAELFHAEEICMFLCMCLAVAVYIMSYGIVDYLYFGRTMARLFVFPSKYVESLKARSSANVSKVPDQLLVVTVVSDSGRIYSVSGNSTKLIGKTPSSMINTFFGDHFVYVQGSEYRTVDSKNPRTFRGTRVEKNQTIQYLLIDSISGIIGSRAKEGLTSLFTRFMSPYFAEKFCTENSRSVAFQDTMIVFLKAREGLSLGSLEQIFSGLSQMCRMFQGLKVIRVVGSEIVLSIPDSGSIISPMLLLREVLGARNIGSGISAVLVEHLDFMMLSFETVDDPYLEWNNEVVNGFESVAYAVPDGLIGFGCHCVARFPSYPCIQREVPPQLIGRDDLIFFELSAFFSSLEHWTRD